MIFLFKCRNSSMSSIFNFQTLTIIYWKQVRHIPIIQVAAYAFRQIGYTRAKNFRSWIGFFAISNIEIISKPYFWPTLPGCNRCKSCQAIFRAFVHPRRAITDWNASWPLKTPWNRENNACHTPFRSKKIWLCSSSGSQYGCSFI